MSHLLTDRRHFASQLSSVHGWLLERIFLTFSPALETLTYLLILPATHFNSHLRMHSHYCVNHFPKHVAVCSGVCSFPFLHFYFKQRHCSNLLSVIATKLCRDNLLPSVGYASMDVEPAASLQFPSCNERGQLLFVKQHSHTECTYCKVPNVQQSLSFTGEWLLQTCKMSCLFVWALPLSVFCLLPSRGREDINTWLVSQPPNRLLQGAIADFPPHYSSTNHQLCKTGHSQVFSTAFSQNIPARETPALQVSGQIPQYGWYVAVALSQSCERTGYSLNCTNPTSCLRSPVPPIHPGRLLGSHRHSAPCALPSLLKKRCSVPPLCSLAEEKVGLATYKHLLEELEHQLEQIYISAAWQHAASLCNLDILIIKASACSSRDQCVPLPEGRASGVIHTCTSPPRPTLTLGRLIFGERSRVTVLGKIKAVLVPNTGFRGPSLPSLSGLSPHTRFQWHNYKFLVLYYKIQPWHRAGRNKKVARDGRRVGDAFTPKPQHRRAAPKINNFPFFMQHVIAYTVKNCVYFCFILNVSNIK